MPGAILTEETRPEQAVNALLSLGRVLFSAAIIALGIETLVCARCAGHSLGQQYAVIPVIPWLPAFPGWLWGGSWALVLHKMKKDNTKAAD